VSGVGEYLRLDSGDASVLLNESLSAADLIPRGESSMWGDYHLLELTLLIRKIASSCYYTFF
jgi:hypothetical protein